MKAHPNASCTHCGGDLIVVEVPRTGKPPRVEVYDYQEPGWAYTCTPDGWVRVRALRTPREHHCTTEAVAEHSKRVALRRRAPRDSALQARQVLGEQEHVEALRYGYTHLRQAVETHLTRELDPVGTTTCPRCPATPGTPCHDMRPGYTRHTTRPHKARLLAAVAAQGHELYWDDAWGTWATRLYQGSAPQHTW